MSDKYPADIDEEIVPLLDALNSIPDVNTTASCCGHGDNTFYAVFDVNDWRAEQLLIERFTLQEGNVHFHFFSKTRMGIYSNKVGKMPFELRKAYFDYWIMQCRKINDILRDETK